MSLLFNAGEESAIQAKSRNKEDTLNNSFAHFHLGVASRCFFTSLQQYDSLFDCHKQSTTKTTQQADKGKEDELGMNCSVGDMIFISLFVQTIYLPYF